MSETCRRRHEKLACKVKKERPKLVFVFYADRWYRGRSYRMIVSGSVGAVGWSGLAGGPSVGELNEGGEESRQS